MTLTAFLLVFLSVFLHATWNFLSKKTNPSGAFYLMSSSTAALLWLGFFLHADLSLSALPPRFWILLICSILCEAVYCLGLAYAYRISDISLAYPLGRALPVLMVAAVTLLFGIGTPPSGLALGGMGIIFAGCILLPLKTMRDFHWKTYASKAIFFILMIAAGTTGYTILDSQASAMLQALPGETTLIKSLVYLFFIELGIALSLAGYVAMIPLERQEFKRLFLRSLYPLLTGLCSSSAYALILLAMGRVSNVSYIQAFRQMSLPLGVLAGIVLLKETPAKPKLAGVALIVIGLVITAL